MAHYGLLRDYRFSDDVDDIRGATLYGADNDKIGKIDDVIFDHDSGTIQYAIVDAGGWLSTKKFLVPAGRIHPSAKDEKDFSTDMTKDQIKSLPEYDEKSVGNDKDWDGYQTRYHESLESGPVLHKENSTHMITPDPSELPATGASAGIVDDSAYEPQRLVGKFPDAEPSSSKIRLRPSGIAGNAEDSSVPGASVHPDIPTRLEEEALDRRQPGSVGTARGRWASFEDHLRRNRNDITTSCRTCGTAADRVA